MAPCDDRERPSSGAPSAMELPPPATSNTRTPPERAHNCARIRSLAVARMSTPGTSVVLRVNMLAGGVVHPHDHLPFRDGNEGGAVAKDRVDRDDEDLVRLYLTDIGQYTLLTKDD